MKIIYIDLETTGTDHAKHGIHQIAGFVENDWKVIETFDFKVQPLKGSLVSEEALKVGNVTIEQLRGYPETSEVFRKFKEMLGRHINKFAKTDKAFFCGYNAGFDNQFLRTWFDRQGDSYFGSWFWSGTLDVMTLALNQLKEQRTSMPNFKLETVAKELGISAEGIAHDAMYDITLTRKMYWKIDGTGYQKGNQL